MVCVGGDTIYTNEDVKNKTEILNLDTLTWSQGPDLPEGKYLLNGVSVPFRDSFVVFGDEGLGTDIFEWSHEAMDWVKREEELVGGGPRQYLAAIPLPEGYIDCTL